MKSSKEIYKDKSKQTFNNQANIYDSTYYGKHAKKLYNSVVEEINGFKCRKILDVGCGTGTVLSILSKKDSICLAGIDLSKDMLNIARQKLNKNVELKIGDSEQLPWYNDIFDAIICTDSFHHYPEPEKVLSEMARVLKDKGHLVIGDPWMISPLRQVFNLQLKYSKSGDYRIYSKLEISRMLVKCGFNSVNWNRLNYSSFVVTAEVNK
ncbi:class I SAM-dependent methyltransferase [Clostridium uliginosum]|uniref:Ubiquinone/menaquinone biosynthesis C-methylase UbiE n=1 Tax=Clostridium uliginosum TaxID=119641 RepID=A0A1I1QUR8_9CLOT|nr:class I SAM-dependent methyltransferase [Clostridium uliginosum]SFD23618.1 Ubiquinone/menaquinone biosynthesis C-methylase UbiE [Clostridium uliginosum]